MNLCKRYHIKGKVQGVGFRYWLWSQVNQTTQLTGYVTNLSTGEVEIFLKGSLEDINKILPLLEKGPRIAKVDSVLEVSAENIDILNLENFKIRY